jgi:predicted Zn-dependent protease with MMP-like domain
MTTRSQRFDELVLDSAERIESRLGRSLDPAELAVEDVPPSDPSAWEDGVPLGRLFPADGRTPPRVVVYRRPIETRAGDERELAMLVQHVVSEQVAAMLGLDPDDLGPD